jgi:hypothetical protein
MNNKQAEREAFYDYYKKEKDLFSDNEQYQVYNYYRPENKPKAEKVLRTFGDKKHCEDYQRQWTPDYLQEYIGDPKNEKFINLKIEPYNADEWQRPKLNGCCILPLEKFEEE